jgi:hypothetical protein
MLLEWIVTHTEPRPGASPISFLLLASSGDDAMREAEQQYPEGQSNAIIIMTARLASDIGALTIYDGSKWLPVTWYIFRSWTGERRVGNVPFTGPVFHLGKETE